MTIKNKIEGCKYMIEISTGTLVENKNTKY